MSPRKEERDRFAHLRKAEAFEGCTDDELERIDSLLAETTVPAGRVLMKENAPGFQFVVIHEGTATVSRGGKEVATVGPGSFLGEMALLDEDLQTRTATVTAETDMRIYVMNAGEFTSLLREVPSMREKILRTKAIRNHPAGKGA